MNAPSLILLEDSGLTWVSGSIFHDYLESCSLSYSSEEEQGQVDVKSDGTWKMLTELYDGVAEMTITFVATCGEWTVLGNDPLDNNNYPSDADGDGILDHNDSDNSGYQIGFLLLQTISILMVAETVMRMTMTMEMGLKTKKIFVLELLSRYR